VLTAAAVAMAAPSYMRRGSSAIAPSDRRRFVRWGLSAPSGIALSFIGTLMTLRDRISFRQSSKNGRAFIQKPRSSRPQGQWKREGQSCVNVIHFAFVEHCSGI
jgi:hypothetical protein